MVFCVREIEALRLLGWCQYIRPAQLLRVVSETELSNLLTMKLIKYHGKSEALILTAEGVGCWREPYGCRIRRERTMRMPLCGGCGLLLCC